MYEFNAKNRRLTLARNCKSFRLASNGAGISEAFVLLVIIIIWGTTNYRRSARKNQADSGSHKNATHLPPGPLGLPFVGILPLLGLNPARKLMEWTGCYGSMLYVRFGSFPTVVLNDAGLIRKALSLPQLNGRASIRLFTRASDGKGKYTRVPDFSGIIFSEGEHHAEQRRFALTNFRDCQLTIGQKMEEELDLFLQKLEKEADKPVRANHLFNTTMVNSLWSVFMGSRFKDDDPKIHTLIDLLQTKLSKTDTLMSNLAMFLPWLDNILGRFGTSLKIRAFKEIYSHMAQEVKVNRQTWIPNDPQNVCHAYMDKVEVTTDINSSFHKQYNTQPYFFGDLFIGALESTSTSLTWLLHYMVKYPETQRALQVEIDQVIGPLRRPNLGDQANMPFAQAVVNELLRFSSIIPFGGFRRVTKDVFILDYQLPTDTMIIPNIYAAHHDPRIWGDPQCFRPERWLETWPDPEVNDVFDHSNEKGKNKEFDQVKGQRLREKLVAFGAGHRKCPGEQMARNSLFLYTVGLFQQFTVEGLQGQPKVRPIFGLAVAPSPFSVVFRKRT